MALSSRVLLMIAKLYSPVDSAILHVYLHVRNKAEKVLASKVEKVSAKHSSGLATTSIHACLLGLRCSRPSTLVDIHWTNVIRCPCLTMRSIWPAIKKKYRALFIH